MFLTDREKEKLYISVAAEVARKRRAKGLKLNHPEAVAVITDYILEGAREGKDVATLMMEGKKVLKKSDVLPGVPEMISIIQVEPTFRDGTKLVSVHNPICED